MYKEFYGFSEEPFALSPDPRFFFLSQNHREVLDSLAYGITERRGFILLTGEVGTGKTILIQQLLQTLAPNIKAISIYQPPKSFEELLEVILQDLKLPLGERNKRVMWRQFIDYISQEAGQYENLAIIVDDAQELSKEIMEELRELWNPNPGRLQEVFVGRPEIKDKLNSWDLRQLNQRFAVRCQLKPLNGDESRRYIEHRLSRVGSNISEIFIPEAISLICHYSGGVPQTINILCDKALGNGFSLSKKPVDSSMVEEILEDLGILPREEPVTGLPVEKIKARLPAPGVKRTSLSRKISYALVPLFCLALIIFLGGTYLKAPMQKITSQFWVQQPEVREKVTFPILKGKPGFGTKVGPLAKQEQKPAGPPPALEPKSAPLALAPMQKPSERAQLLVKAPSAPSPDLKRRATVSRPSQPSAVSQASQDRVKSVVTVQKGDSLYILLRKYCQVANTTLVDYVLELNPTITNPHRILVNQKVNLPAFTEQSLIFKSLEGTFKIQLGTFSEPEYAGFLREDPVLKGKEIEIISRKVPSGETWYRVIAGPFETEEEGLKVIHSLRKKGLSPFFAGSQKENP